MSRPFGDVHVDAWYYSPADEAAILARTTMKVGVRLNVTRGYALAVYDRTVLGLTNDVLTAMYRIRIWDRTA